MIRVTFSAFSFLQEKLKARGSGCYHVEMRLKEGSTVETLVLEVGFGLSDVEAAFINGRICSLDTILHDGDRVALVPPGTPGPHRMLMGIYQGKTPHTGGSAR